MVTVLIRHKVADFNTWKASFDAAFSLRKASGENSFRLYRDATDPSALTLLFEWDTAEHADKFLKSEELRLEMKHAGVLGDPEMRVLLEVVAMRRTAAD
ncbi:MAG TPA: antibiotic biosynthesis monooxygenase [Terriglobales bacterium]|nr:antibiotic biosynthesis monooxygenase [Terriglobales bacterium]